MQMQDQKQNQEDKTAANTTSTPLFSNHPYQHQPQNVNLLFLAEQETASFNEKVAVGLTKIFSAMPTFWLILSWIVLWILANATIVSFDPLPWPLLLCLASVPQLPLMIVIMVGQGLLGRKQELQVDEQFDTTRKIYSDIEQMMAHLTAQDDEILRQTQLILQLQRSLDTLMHVPSSATDVTSQSDQTSSTQ